MLIKWSKKNIIDFKRIFGSSFEETWIPFTQGCFVPSLVEIGSVVLEKKIFKFCQCISAISLSSPLDKKGVTLHLNKLEFPSPKDASHQVWLKLAQRFWRRRFSKFINVFSLFFVIISPWKKMWPSIWRNLNPLYTRMLCVKIGWNCLRDSGGEDFFFISSM